jgi:putative endonuclease
MSTLEIGSWAEDRAVRLLVRAGYRIVERNFRCKAGELDIVARERGVLCFVEVRSRRDDLHGHAAEMVGRRKQAQVTRVAQHYLAQRAPRFECARFDVVALTGDDELLIRDAWRVRGR